MLDYYEEGFYAKDATTCVYLDQQGRSGLFLRACGRAGRYRSEIPGGAHIRKRDALHNVHTPDHGRRRLWGFLTGPVHYDLEYAGDCFNFSTRARARFSRRTPAISVPAGWLVHKLARRTDAPGHARRR